MSPNDLVGSPSAVLGLGIALFVVVGAVGFWVQHKRRERLGEWARLNGWTYRLLDRFATAVGVQDLRFESRSTGRSASRRTTSARPTRWSTPA